MWIFMILVMFLTIYYRIPLVNGPGSKPKSLNVRFSRKIECWDGSISHATGHTDHQNSFLDGYDELL